MRLTILFILNGFLSSLPHKNEKKHGLILLLISFKKGHCSQDGSYLHRSIIHHENPKFGANMEILLLSSTVKVKRQFQFFFV